MSTALLNYVCTPDQVGIGTSASPSRVGMTFLASNKGVADVPIDQIALSLPQGDGDTDLLAPDTTFVAGSVRSSNGTAWTAIVSANQVVLLPVTQKFYTIARGDSLQFTLSDLLINAAGAGQAANIAVYESIHNGSVRSTRIAVHKVQPEFRIESFFLDQYNVAVGSPVTVTWKVVGALSCSVTAKVIEMGLRKPGPTHRAATGGEASANPSCTGALDSTCALAGTRTCDVLGATIFTLLARGKGTDGDVTLTSELLVTVNEPAIHFTVYPPDISKGEYVKLRWIAADAGRLLLWTKPSGGQHTQTDLTATPVGKLKSQLLIDTRYSLCAFAGANDTYPAEEIPQEVSVEQPQWKSPPAASGAPVPAYPGDTATLSWEVLNVDHCRLTCDLAGFEPLDKLRPQGSQMVTLPDPGVANGAATFTLTPVQLAGLGDFTPMSVAVPVTNIPNFVHHFDPDQETVPTGGNINFTWQVEHADTAAISTNLPGDKPVPVDPKAGHATVQMAPLVVPSGVDYRLTVSQQGGKYVATSDATVCCAGQTTTTWCRSTLGTGTDYDYLYLINLQTPNARIRKVRMEYSDGWGVTALKLWYSDAANPDYILPNPSVPACTSSAELEIPAGDTLASLDALFANDPSTYPYEYILLWHLKLTTTGGVSAEIGSTSPPGTADGPYHVAAPVGQQIIALDYSESGASFCGFGVVCCAATYGQ